jgi:hypothetical protein
MPTYMPTFNNAFYALWHPMVDWLAKPIRNRILI